MKQCKNPTCDREASATYCSRVCQIAMRTVSKGRCLPDVWLPMSQWHTLRRMAAEEQLTVQEVVRWAIDDWMNA